MIQNLKDVLTDKQILREKFLDMRLKMSPEELKQRSEKVIQNLVSIKYFVTAKNVLIYYPIKNEVDLLCLLDRYQDKNFYFPVIDFENKQLKIRRYNGEFYENKYGIKEPTGTQDSKPAVIDFAIIPGIVFDKKGYRIGYGGGYYDKFLKNFQNISCGVCFDEQIVDELPNCDYDVKVDYIVSDKRIIPI